MTTFRSKDITLVIGGKKIKPTAKASYFTLPDHDYQTGQKYLIDDELYKVNEAYMEGYKICLTRIESGESCVEDATTLHERCKVEGPLNGLEVAQWRATLSPRQKKLF